MIGTIILGLGAVAAAMAIAANWKEVVKWFKDFVTALSGLFASVIKGIAHAGAAFITVVKEGVAGVMHKLYYEEEGHYVEEVRVRHLQENELPAWAKRKLNKTAKTETEITDEMESELKMTL